MHTEEQQASPSGAAAGAAAPVGFIRDLIIAARPLQWQKNLLLYAAFIFSARTAWSWRAPEDWIPLFLLATVGFLLFNAISSGEYMVNDALDVERDREHPRKRLRPIAAGRISVRTAFTVGTGLVVGAVALSFLLSVPFGLVALGYAALTFAYSFALKHLVIVDVITIASGFALRAMAGAVVIAVPISPWLFVVTTLGALFIAVAKRRQELVLLGSESHSHRGVLREYSLDFLDQMSSVSAAATIVAYALYAVTAENLPDDDSMLLTLPFVIYGVFRYRLIAQRNPERNADEMIMRDLPLLLSVVLFALTALVVLAFDR
jgi:4-hydroxybenzoate polyprenyltransferase